MLVYERFKRKRSDLPDPLKKKRKEKGRKSKWSFFYAEIGVGNRV
jgi:hypothetical protein